MPQDETAIAKPDNAAEHPRRGERLPARPGTSGFYASTDNGSTGTTASRRSRRLPSGDNLDGGGDPVTVFDRDGIAYYAQINFNRTDDTNGVWVHRSTNGGFTWTRPCVAVDADGSTTTVDEARLRRTRRPAAPGDGTSSSSIQDNDNACNGTISFNDKEWIADRAAARRRDPDLLRPRDEDGDPGGEHGCPTDASASTGIYVTWTRFARARQLFASGTGSTSATPTTAAHSWSPREGDQRLGSLLHRYGHPRATYNQGSVPTVNPTTGHLWVAWINGNTPDQDQYLVARSNDGGNTFTGPFYVAPVFDLN